MTRRPLVLIVGRGSPSRDSTSQRLIERGMAVVLCSGPPGCMLEYDDRCVLRDLTDVTVLFEPRVAERLATCAAAAAGHIVVSGPHPDADLIADAVTASFGKGASR